MHLIVFIVLAATLTACCIWQTHHWAINKTEWKDHDRAQIYAPRELAWKLHLLGSDENLTNQESITMLHERLSPVFDKRLEQYRANIDILNKNLWYQMIFVVAAFIVVFRTSPEFTVPVLDIKAPVEWVCLAIPLCLGYLWVRFGFTLNELIDARIALWKIADAMQAPSNAFANSADWQQALYTFSYDPAIYDGGFLDGWFITFQPDYTLGYTHQLIPSWLSSFFAVFLGISNGTMLGLILHGSKKFARTKDQTGFYTTYFWISASVLGLTHWAFWKIGQHPNWWQTMIAAIACTVPLLMFLMPTNRSFGEGDAKA